MTAALRRPRDESGAVVVVAVGLIGVLVVVALTCAGCAALVVTHRRAQVAADLGALAGAAALQQGGDPCSAAARIAGRHAASLAACVVEGQSVLVTASVALAVPLTEGSVSARARAGPATALPSSAGLSRRSDPRTRPPG